MRWSIEHGMVVRRVGQGPRSGPRVVWIHGLGESSVSFEPVIAKLPGFSHVLVDLPGYGRSPWPEAAVGLDDMAAGLASWLDEDTPATLVGHSMGGVLCTLIAERTAVRAVVNVDGNLTRGDCTFSALAAEYALDEFRASGFDALRAKAYVDGVSRPELRSYHAAMCLASPAMFHRHAVELVELSSGGTLAARLAALHVPKLFIAGVPNGCCVESRAQLDKLGVRWIGIEPAGHWVYLDQTERFSAELAKFLADV
jgi:pimeloyl-ACP methyl ester carboxylesterase